MQSQKPNFPFSAVTGQPLFKLALTLIAINPAIGGLLISGPRGSAKSTLAKGLADVMPNVNSKSDSPVNTTPSFVTLPLSVTEEMVVGTLDLQQVLNEKQVVFQEGLLAKANKGILYVDEVNLLQDHIVDLLLDVAASGVNIIERDGISHEHESKFILLGTMNPDEGELRPQLQDRFGLSVELSHDYSINQRIEIVQRREAFDANHIVFLQEYKNQQDELRDAILATKTLLPKVTCKLELQKLIAQRCQAAQVDGLRADIIWHRAALTHAALCKRLEVTEEDIDVVEELVLSHRRKNTSDSQNPPKLNDGQDQQDQQQTKSFSQPKEAKAKIAQVKEDQAEGDWGQMQPQQHEMTQLSDFELTLPTRMLGKHKLKKQLSNRTAKSTFKNQRSFNASSQLASQGQNESKRINWLSSLLSGAGQWPLQQLRFYQTKRSQTVLNIVLIDTSASILTNNLFSQAKAVILKVAKQAYIAREQLSIIGFGNQTVETLLPRQRAPKELNELLNDIPAGGGTPFCEALEHAEKFQQQQYRQTPDIRIKTIIITDGKTSQPFSHVNLGDEVVLIDIEQSVVKRGKGQNIADELNAFYMPLFS